MKIFTNKDIWKKIIIAFLLVLSFQTVIAKPVQADVVEFGGKLMGPIMSLLVSLSDGINNTISRSIMGNLTTLYEVDRSDNFGDWVKTILAGVVIAAIAAVAIIATAGGIAALAGALFSIKATVTFGIGTVIAVGGAGLLGATWYHHTQLPDELYLPMYTYSAEEIFKGNILLYDINYFKEPTEIYAKTKNGVNIKLSDYNTMSEAEEEIKNDGGLEHYFFKDQNKRDENNNPVEVITSNQNSAAVLRKTVSSWYNTLRNICLVLMLSVLVYIGIRILLSSVSSDKAKYLVMLKDWFIGLCLLFLMHYIMAFSVTLVEKLTDVVKTSVNEDGFAVVMPVDEKIETAITELNKTELIQATGENGEDKQLIWPTNLMGSLRLKLQMEDYGGQYVGYSICYIMLVLFTLYFTVVYLKRVLHMAFLTIIAPMVALTYCIDKINDGKAQGFDKWLKEYIFNLLIQPMHLLLYYILITSAFELASTNTIYSIVAIGFMIPAEKLLRSLFGFEKAQTAPVMGPAGAMMASTAINQLLNRGSKRKGNAGGGGSKDDSDSTSGKVPNPSKDNLLEEFASEDNGGNAGNDAGDNEPPRDLVMDKYNAEGFSQNANGEYYNPWIDEYDSEYDPHNDDYYNQANSGSATNNGAEQQPTSDDNTPPRQVEPPNLAEEGKEGKEGQPEEQELPGEDEKKEKKQPRTKAGRRVQRMFESSVAAQKAAIRNTPRKIKKSIENSHPLKAAGKIAAGAVVGATTGAIGTAIAATTGDPNNIPKIGGAMAATGYAVGSGRAQAIKTPLDDPKVKAVYDQAYNKGEEGKYKQDAMDDYVKSYLKDVENVNYFEQKFGKSEAKEMLKRGGMVEKCLNHEVTDKKDIAAAYKLKQKNVVDNDEKAIAIAQLSQMVGGNTKDMTEKRRDEWRKRFSVMAGDSGIQGEKAKENFAKKRMSELDKFNDFKK